jgi:adenosylmethionine-8-amino-7-oxononanoate aminotransferase
MSSLPSLAVVAPDTDMGKTTLSALLLHAAAQRDLALGYWKPAQSGPPDSERVAALCETIPLRQHPAARSFELPAAPSSAARAAGEAQVTLSELLAAAPSWDPDAPCLVETLGGPLSPIAEGLLQAELLVALGLPILLVTKNRVGAISGMLCSIESLRSRGLSVRAVVLLGPEVDGNRDSIAAAAELPVFEIDWPGEDEASAGPAAYAERARELAPLLEELLAQQALSAPAGRSSVSSSGSSQQGETDLDTELRELDERELWHPFTPLLGDAPRPICRRAQGEWLELDTGERLVDGISSWWTCIHGHAHPRIRAALAEAAQKHDQVIFAGLAHEPGVRLAHELLEFLPREFSRVFYSDNGSTANEVALKIVFGGWRRRGPVAEGERRLFLCLENAYHGDTFGTMAVGRDPVFFAEWEGLLFETVQIPMSLEAIDAAIERYGAQLAGLIVEPLIQAAGGMHVHAPELVAAFCERARAAGLPVIFDEVMTGFGRTGTMFAFEQLGKAQAGGFVPDLLCLAKGLSGGVLPLAATVVNEAWTEPWLIEDRAKMLFHGHSYTANPLACSTGRAGLELWREGSTAASARRICARWEGLLERDWPDHIERVRRCGTVFAYDIGDRGAYLSDLRDRVIELGRKEQVFLRPLGNVVYAMPPLTTSEAGLDRIEAALRRIADETA